MDEIGYNIEVDNIIHVAKSIKPGKITILTGQNGHGKSVIRKILGSHISKLCNVDKNSCVASTSMQLRTELRSSWGALSTMAHDNPEHPTSLETYHNIRRLFKSTIFVDSKRYLVIDEPEIGCSEETQLGIANYINKFAGDFHDSSKCFGLLVITHSKTMVSALNHDEFINLDGKTESEWINRKIEPVDLEALEQHSQGLYHAINKRTGA